MLEMFQKTRRGAEQAENLVLSRTAEFLKKQLILVWLAVRDDFRNWLVQNAA